MPPDYFFIAQLLFLAAAGFAGAFYGVSVSGGSLIALPALIFTGMPIPLVIATNRFAVLWVELVGVLGFRAHVTFDRPFALLCGLVGSIGAFIGSRLVLSIDDHILNVIVAVLLTGISIFLLFRKKWGEGSLTLPCAKKILMLLVMPFIGLYAGFFGAAHGVFSMMILTGCGLAFFQSAATTRTIGFMISVTAAASFMQAGAIQWPQAIALSVGYIAGGWLGVRLSVQQGVGIFRRMMIVVALASAAKLVWDAMR